MNYKWYYKTPDGFDNMMMNSDGKYLTGLWFLNSKDSSKHLLNGEEKRLPIFEKTCTWLDIYFSGQEPDFIPEYKLNNLTVFRSEVTDIMNTIPFGSTLNYNDIAKKIALKRKIEKMSSQAVGGAVGANPICLIIPCHRVVGAKGNLTGYGGGLNNKIALLKLEKHNMEEFHLPKKRGQKCKDVNGVI